MSDVLMMNRIQAEAVANVITQARSMKAYVQLLAGSPTPPDELLIEQARKLADALAAVDALR
jgi:hypothetical protein